MRRATWDNLNRGLGAAAVILAVLAPLYLSHYWVSALFTQALWLGIAAASLIFLSAYGGMVSLGQTAIYGIAGLVFGNLVTTGEAKGIHLAWNPWVSLVVAIAVATAIGLLIGLLASRSAGIYFLMLTLTFGVLTYTFFVEVEQFGGFSGISGTPDLTIPPIGNASDHADRLYYVALAVSLLTYGAIRYLVRTPFGLTLQGIRDDPVRMASLGYNVILHRMLAFGFGAFIASLAGVLFVWWNNHIDPNSINLDNVIVLLLIAVIGGLYRIEGAWLGAFAYVIIENEVNNWLGGGTVPVIGGTFNTVIGVIFLAIVLVSPGGLLGIWESIGKLLTREGGGASNHGPPVPSATPAEGGT
jgi:branched-chain amino acid transport system permease protein